MTVTPKFTCGAGLMDIPPQVNVQARPVRRNDWFGQATFSFGCRPAAADAPGSSVAKVKAGRIDLETTLGLYPSGTLRHFGKVRPRGE